MHDNRELVEERIERELFERVVPYVHPCRVALDVVSGPSPDAMAPTAVGTPWGAPWATTWFRFTGELPPDWSGRRVEAIVDLGFDLDMPGFQCEGLVRTDDGEPVQGIHPRRTAIAVSGATVDLLVEAASNPTFPQFQPSALGRLATAGDEPLYVLRRADAVVVDSDAEALLHDLDVANGVMRTFGLRDPRRPRLLRALERALDVLAATDDPAAARRAIAPALAARSAERGHRAVAAGHAHIDTAWLWPLRETRRKCVRTFTSAVAMMDADPEYRFVCSQAQQYEWIREAEPALFERIRAHVAGGQFVPIGGMWVEADMNLPSGESIARQIVHGQRYFEEHFGVRCTEMWIPDVFGYPAGMPQVFAAGGMSRFVTQKLSWNRTNRFPHHTFWWEGLDGTRVLTHFPPVDTYNAEITPAEMARSIDRFAEHAWSDWSLVPYGHGDGGGGPTREMLERARRMADLDGMPRVQLGTAADFFEHVEGEIAAGATAPVWRGELYFETHRGTLTSQLGTKLGNRRCERLLREVELLAATAAVGGSVVDPHELDDAWRRVLTQQFHDIIPGSSIGWVHDDAEADLGGVAAELDERVGRRLDELAPSGPVVVNVATMPRREVVVGDAASSGDGPRQELRGGRVAFVAAAPGLGVGSAEAVAAADDDGTPWRPIVVTDRSMTSGHLAVAWSPNGELTSVIDVAHGRELLSAPGAVLELAVDRPVRYDAWDLESWTVEHGVALGPAERVEVEAAGPLVGIVAVHYEFGASAAVVRYILRSGSPRLDIEIELDWHHREHLLSMSFPIDVRTDTATCGVQFGAVKRPTHASTSWDAAKFEVCAHRYVDVAEPSFGVAVLNDGRYGHGVFGGRIRVSLARGPRYPDPDADEGRHGVTLALMPHGAGLTDVVSEAERLEYPLRLSAARPAGGASASEPGGDGVRGRSPRAERLSAARPGGDGVTTVPAPVVTMTAAGVEVDAVKVADDGTGDVVVRLHEAVGDRAPVTVRARRRIVAASACNLLEEPERHFEVSDGIVAMTLSPFQIVTLRLTLEAP